LSLRIRKRLLRFSILCSSMTSAPCCITLQIQAENQNSRCLHDHSEQFMIRCAFQHRRILEGTWPFAASAESFPEQA
jgi:hypothetical protein